jgi:hypothetical protein
MHSIGVGRLSGPGSPIDFVANDDPAVRQCLERRTVSAPSEIISSRRPPNHWVMFIAARVDHPPLMPKDLIY